MSTLSKITIKGYKSIENLENFELTNLNILLGENGAGKSNFISVFKLLANMYEQNLQLYIQKNGGVDALLHYGRKNTKQISMKFIFNEPHLIPSTYYQFNLIPTQDNRLIFANESRGTGNYVLDMDLLNGGHSESKCDSLSLSPIYGYKHPQWRIHHFHDTSETASVKKPHSVTDNLRLKTDAANLAAFLTRLKKRYEKNYHQIVRTIQLVAPFFHDFVHRENEEYVELEWFEKGDLDTPFKAHILSDGTLRFICLQYLRQFAW